MNAIDWYVAYTNVQAEEGAKKGLERRGFAVFMPMHACWVRKRHARILTARPLFPRYLFVGFRARCSWMDFHKAAGVQGALVNNGAPLKISTALIDQLQQAAIAGEFDQKEPSRIMPGAQVRFSRGPFEGLIGICQAVNGEARAKVLVEFLKREVICHLSTSELSIIN